MFVDLYKSQGIHSREYRQSERRRAQLELQKQRRDDLANEHRSIEPLKKLFRKPKYSKRLQIKNTLMLSEWLREVPDDLEKWYLKPCPKGTRVLVIAVDGTTRVFNKYGAFMRRLRSDLPGHFRKSDDSLTILDCVYVSAIDKFFVLDVLAYGNQALNDCDAECRFFWLESRIRELNLDQVTDQNECSFQIIEKYNCADEIGLNAFFANYPVWPENQPELDGFLFYHKEASYVNGKTPLVGWLFAFMIPEFFHVPCFNGHFLADKPDDYQNHSSFMTQFDEKLLEKQKNRRNRASQMEEDNIIENEPNPDSCDDAFSIVKDTMELETGAHELDASFDVENELN